MMRSIMKLVVCPDGARTFADFISGVADKKREVKEIWFEQTNAMDLVAAVDTDIIHTVPSEVNQADFQPVRVNYVLKAGETFQAGFDNGSGGALNKHVVVFYEETP